MMVEQALNTQKSDSYSPDEYPANDQKWSEESDLRRGDWSDRLELLRHRINDDGYLHAAIHRLALVLSNELMDISSEGGRNERKRRK
ncbi:MAG: hypothetical protein FWC06_07805 [Treponema sp.]|nr:hypothetical protein [Treponema sp.]